MSRITPKPADDGQTYSSPVETRGGNRPADYIPVDAEEAFPDGEDGADSYPRRLATLLEAADAFRRRLAAARPPHAMACVEQCPAGRR